MEGVLAKRKTLTFGADPEMFVMAGEELIPAFNFLPPNTGRQLLYWDGFQAEWKYLQPHYCQNNLIEETRDRLMLLADKVKLFNPQGRLTLKNVVKIPVETLQTAQHAHVELGCQPSFNAYNLAGMKVPNARQLKFRFAGGHMHFGTWKRTKPNYEKIIKTLDMILGVWAVGVAQNWDDPVRRKFYGLPGEYRAPNYATGYGVEYRTLSNWWLASPRIMQLTWDIGRTCVQFARSRYWKLWAGDEKETIHTIQSCDVDQARRIIWRNRGLFTWLLKQTYPAAEEACIERVFALCNVGLEAVVPYPEDFAGNWHFQDDWIPDAKVAWARWDQGGL